MVKLLITLVLLIGSKSLAARTLQLYPTPDGVINLILPQEVKMNYMGQGRVSFVASDKILVIGDGWSTRLDNLYPCSTLAISGCVPYESITVSNPEPSTILFLAIGVLCARPTNSSKSLKIHSKNGL